MANPSHTLVTATGTYYFWPDWMQSPFNLSYQVGKAAAATTAFTVSFTLDNPNINPGANDYGWTTIWIPDPVNGTSQTGSVAGFYSNPIRGLRLVVSALSGGNLLWQVLQGMSAR